MSYDHKEPKCQVSDEDLADYADSPEFARAAEHLNEVTELFDQVSELKLERDRLRKVIEAIAKVVDVDPEDWPAVLSRVRELKADRKYLDWQCHR